MSDKACPAQTAVYLQRIQEIMPDLGIIEFDINTEGLINDVIIVNKERVFRFGKYEWAEADLKQEALCLSLARKYLDMPLP